MAAARMAVRDLVPGPATSARSARIGPTRLGCDGPAVRRRPGRVPPRTAPARRAAGPAEPGPRRCRRRRCRGWWRRRRRGRAPTWTWAAPVASIRVARSQAPKPPGWLERHGDQPDSDGRSTGDDGHDQSAPPTGRWPPPAMRASTANDWIDRLPEPGQQPERDHRGDPVPAARPGPPGQEMSSASSATMSNE